MQKKTKNHIEYFILEDLLKKLIENLVYQKILLMQEKKSYVISIHK